MLTPRLLPPPSKMEEWSLFDHIVFLAGKWPFLLAIALVFAASAFGVGVAFRKRSFGEGILRVGEVRTIGFVEKPPESVTRLNSVSFMQALIDAHPDRLPADVDAIKFAAQDIGGTGLVRITTEAPEEAMARDVIQLAADRLEAEHAERFRQIRKVFDAKLADVERRIAELEAAAAAALPQAGDDGARLYVQIERNRTFEQLSQLRNLRFELQLGAEPAMEKRTGMIEGPTSWSKSGSRKAGLLGLMTGLSFGMFLAYMSEIRRRTAAGASQPASA